MLAERDGWEAGILLEKLQAGTDVTDVLAVLLRFRWVGYQVGIHHTNSGAVEPEADGHGPLGVLQDMKGVNLEEGGKRDPCLEANRKG